MGGFFFAELLAFFKGRDFIWFKKFHFLQKHIKIYINFNAEDIKWK